jgi:signal peptidase I
MMTPKRRLVETAEAVLVAAALALTFKGFVFQIFHVPSSSMEDTVLAGDYVLVNKFAYGTHRGPWARVLPYRDLARGDVVVFRYPPDPGRDLIKRAVAVAGDRIEAEAKALRVNAAEPFEPYAVHRDVTTYGTGAPPSLLRRDRFAPFAVKAGHFFAMGDNRDESLDSRFWGPVPLAHLEGRAVSVLWSVQESSRAFAGRGAALRRFLDTALNFLSRTRWKRSFHAIR